MATIDSSTNQSYQDMAKRNDEMRALLRKHLEPLGVTSTSRFFDGAFSAMKELNSQLSPPSEASEQKEVNDDVIKFLCGEGPLKGTWFHDDQRPEGEKGIYWWRKYLREYASQFTRPSVEPKCSTCGKGKNEKDTEFCSNSFHLPSSEDISVTQSEKGETAEDVLKRCLLKWCPEKEQPDFEKDWKERVDNDVFKAINEAMQEHSLLERSRAIDEAMKTINKYWPNDSSLSSEYTAMIDNLVKLKSRQ